MKLLGALILLCIANGQQNYNKEIGVIKNPIIYHVYDIDSIKGCYIIYSQVGNSRYKIVSFRSNNNNARNIYINHNYEFNLTSIFYGLKINGQDVNDNDFVKCKQFNDSTTVCEEPPLMRDIYTADNVDGLHYNKQ
jgi:hypothetical protein